MFGTHRVRIGIEDLAGARGRAHELGKCTSLFIAHAGVAAAASG
jgi:hypothetical protein